MAIWATWQGIAFTHFGAVIAGFLLGALVFLGHGQARTTEDVRSGLVVDRRAARNRRCSGVSARWCPLHGECTCAINHPDEDELQEITMDNRSCPLHGGQSLHGAT
jgi:hypothetical protein